MEDIFDFMINNEYFSMALIALLVVLIILFFVILFLGKGKKTKNEVLKDETNIENTPVSTDNNINFDHGEYVKETTAEFELAPISEVAPTPDGFVPEVQEESPAIKFDSKDEPVLKDFSFDELSKSISDELDKLKIEEEQAELAKNAEIPVVEPKTEIPASKEISEPVKPVEVPQTEAPAFITDATAIEKEDTMVLPKLAVEEVKKEVIQEQANKPIISDEEVPLFQRFNQETFDINKKD